MMNTEDVLRHCDAYLDGQVDPALAGEIERHLAADPATRALFESRRQFHSLTKRGVAVPEPEGLEDRIRARYAAPVIKSAPPSRRHWKWMMSVAAAMVVLAGGAAFLSYYYSHEECLYILACVEEHRAVVRGESELEVRSADPVELARYIDRKLNVKIPQVPALTSNKLAPRGAGIAHFSSLKQYDAPDAVFVSYQSFGGKTVTLFFQPWPEEEPENFNRMTYKGRTYWAAAHNGAAAVCWKSVDGKLLCSAVSEQSKEDVLEIASAASAALPDTGEALKKAATLDDKSVGLNVELCLAAATGLRVEDTTRN